MGISGDLQKDYAKQDGRTGAGVALSGMLYPSHRHLQPPPARLRRRTHHLPPERLCLWKQPVVLRARHCRECGTAFSVCEHCNRGQCRCSQSSDSDWKPGNNISAASRLRRANACMTDHGSVRSWCRDARTKNNLGNCAICGCYSRWIDLSRDPPRWNPLG